MCVAMVVAAGLLAPGPASATPEHVTGPSRTNGAWVAKILTTTTVRTRPGAGKREWTARVATPYNDLPQRLMVLGARTVGDRSWVRVRLPRRPNSAAGWVPRDRVALARRSLSIQIRLRSRQLRVYARGHLIRRSRVVVGAPATPTPTGLFSLYEKVRQRNPRGFIGPWALHLTAHSNVLDNYGGGEGRVAIHGRSGASLLDPLGTARSHGCIRVRNDVVRWLAVRAPGGSPVWVTRR